VLSRAARWAALVVLGGWSVGLLVATVQLSKRNPELARALSQIEADARLISVASASSIAAASGTAQSRADLRARNTDVEARRITGAVTVETSTRSGAATTWPASASASSRRSRTRTEQRSISPTLFLGLCSNSTVKKYV